MPQPRPTPIELDSAHSCDRQQAEPSRHEPRNGLVGRLASRREERLALHALRIAGEPNLILDLPCGSGRFLPLLTRHANRLVLAADESAERLALAIAGQREESAQRIRALHTSALSIDLGENAVDAIFCMRFLHQMETADSRLAVLREFHRVTRDTLIVSLWVDGNYQAWRRTRLERRGTSTATADGRQNRFVVRRAQIEDEFRSVGFHTLSHLDLLPGIAMWRVYVLRKAS
ncbi:Methyltransferase domain protein [compost metagenome]